MKQEYIYPAIEELNLSSSALLANSPKPGENETISYEDWDV